MTPMIQRPFHMELALLGLLSHNPQHGYLLYQQFASRTGLGRVWRLKPSQLYALLEKLESAGLVASQIQPQEPHPPRRIFSLTPAGRLAYLNWRVAAVERPNQMRQEFIARLYFCMQESSQDAQMLVERQRQTALKWLEDLEGRSEAAQPVTAFDRQLRLYRKAQVKMILAWLEDCQAELAGKQGAK